MTEAEEVGLYGEAFRSYCALFGAVNPSDRAIWFFTMDEAEILSYPVSAGQHPHEASLRHGVKLAAMADALEFLLGSEAVAYEVQDLRRIAKLHGYPVN